MAVSSIGIRADNSAGAVEAVVEEAVEGLWELYLAIWASARAVLVRPGG